MRKALELYKLEGRCPEKNAPMPMDQLFKIQEILEGFGNEVEKKWDDHWVSFKNDELEKVRVYSMPILDYMGI